VVSSGRKVRAKKKDPVETHRSYHVEKQNYGRDSKKKSGTAVGRGPEPFPTLGLAMEGLGKGTTGAYKKKDNPSQRPPASFSATVGGVFVEEHEKTP